MATASQPTAGPEPIEIIEDGGIHYFKQGNLKFPLDATSDVKAVQVLDKLNRGTWMALANLNHFPVNPFNEVLIKPLLIGVIQINWRKRFDNNLEKLQVLEENQARRVEKYKAEIQKAKEVGPAKEKKGRERAPSLVGKVRKSQLYAIAKGAKLGQPVGKQLFIILQAMVDLGKPASSQDIAEKIRGVLVTNQDPVRVVGYYMNQEQKSGLIVALDVAEAAAETKRLETMQAEFRQGLAAQGKEQKEKTKAQTKKANDSRKKKGKTDGDQAA